MNANENSSAPMTPPGQERFQRASAWMLLLLVPLGAFAYVRDRLGWGKD